MKHIQINCDLGEWESPEQTAALMENIHLANIACGGHAGNKESIQHCDELARQHGVLTGAHPGIMGNKGRTLPDGFTLEDFIHLLENQIQFYLDAGAYLHHIKLHGALYHLSEHNAEIRQALLDYVSQHETQLVCLANGNVAREAKAQGLSILQEAFLDRNYLPDGNLVPRESSNAFLTNIQSIQERIAGLETAGGILDLEGQLLPMEVNTLCIHSDSESSVEIARVAMKVLSGI